MSLRFPSLSTILNGKLMASIVYLVAILEFFDAKSNELVLTLIHLLNSLFHFLPKFHLWSYLIFDWPKY